MTSANLRSDPTGLSRDAIAAIQAYWNERIHDQEMTKHAMGTKGFFDDLYAYRFEKLDYLPRVVDFEGYRDKRMLEVGCGIGTDLVRFAKGGAVVTGVDLAKASIDLAKQNFELNGVSGQLSTMNGEALPLEEWSFDVVYAHGVLQYTHNAQRMVDEIHRVLRPGGEAILMVYNRYSWLYAMSKLFGTRLEHEDAPAFKTFSIREFRSLLSGFSHIELTPERFPVKTRLHKGLKAGVYNGLFVGGFNMIPKPVVRPFGWHIMAKVFK